MGPALAMAADKEPNKFNQAKRQDFKFQGEITALDAAAGTVTVNDKDKGPITLSVPQDCMLFVKHKKGAATLADFKVGNGVKLLYVQNGTNVVCTSMWQPGSHPREKEHKIQKESKSE